MVRSKDWTDTEWRSSQSPNENFEKLSERLKNHHSRLLKNVFKKKKSNSFEAVYKEMSGN